MAVDIISTAGLLDSLTETITSATTAFPSDEQNLLPPTDGISLLDVKNDLLLSYLQNLVFLIILRLRDGRYSEAESKQLSDNVVKKLIELRVYIERGVRPLEGRLRYQIDKVLRAADDAERTTSQKSVTKSLKKKSTVTNGHNSSDSSNAESEDESAAENDEETREMMYRPNAAALVQKTDTAKPTSAARASTTGAYRPPRITPTSMPDPVSARDRDADGPSRRRKSNLLNEYIDEELSTAPVAQPSIGSNNTILANGRSGMSVRDREKERERTEYEERNFTRLPVESKAERKKAKARGERDRRDVFGGEDWTGLGGLGDRIHRSVAGKGGNNVLARREKRGRDTVDGPRGDGVGMAIGETFEKRRKVLDDRAQRKRGGRR